MLELIDIPFNKWVHFIVRGDLSVVGEENAERLLNSYHSAIKSFKGGQLDESRKELSFYYARIKVTESLLNLLAVQYNERIVTMLREWWLYPLTEETYKNDAECIVAECGVYLVEYERHLADIKKLSGDNGEETTEESEYQRYADILNAISKMPNVGFVPSDIDTQRFVSLYNDLISLHEKANRDAAN